MSSPLSTHIGFGVGGCLPSSMNFHEREIPYRLSIPSCLEWCGVGVQSTMHFSSVQTTSSYTRSIELLYMGREELFENSYHNVLVTFLSICNRYSDETNIVLVN